MVSNLSSRFKSKISEKKTQNEMVLGNCMRSFLDIDNAPKKAGKRAREEAGARRNPAATVLDFVMNNLEQTT